MCTLIAFPRAKGTDLATPGQHRGAGLGQSLIRFVLSANVIDRLARGGGEDTAPPLLFYIGAYFAVCGQYLQHAYVGCFHRDNR